MSPAAASDAAVGAPGEKRVSWAELFFDLVFVFAVTEVSSLLARDHSWAGLLRALVAFVPVYWVWVGTAIQTNIADTNQPRIRLVVFSIALCGVFLAIALPGAYHSTGVLFAGAYWAARLLLGLLALARGLRLRSGPGQVLVLSMVVTGPLLLLGALLPPPARAAVWAVAAAVDLATPTLFQARLRSVHYDAGHLAERFGLFVLIALGESVVAIGAAAASRPVTVGAGGAVAAAFALCCGLWWVYFHFAQDAVRHALATARVQLDITRLVLSYGHLSFIAGVVAVAVGLRSAVEAAGSRLGWATAGLLFGGTALYLATFGYTRWAMFRQLSTTRLTAAALTLILLPAAAQLPSLAAVALLAGGVAALNGIEMARVHRAQRAARSVPASRA